MIIDIKYTAGCWATAVACLRQVAPMSEHTWYGQSGHGGPATLVMAWEESMANGLRYQKRLVVRFV